MTYNGQNIRDDLSKGVGSTPLTDKQTNKPGSHVQTVSANTFFNFCLHLGFFCDIGCVLMNVSVNVLVLVNDTMFLRPFSASGCCWLSNVEGKTNWTSYAELNLGTRSDSMTFNNCPVTATVSSLRYKPLPLWDLNIRITCCSFHKE